MKEGIQIVKTEDLSGQRFGRLVVIEQSEDRILPSGKKEAMFKCRCDCGNEKNIRSTSLKNGNTISCGCYRSECSRSRVAIHGMSNTRLHNTWKSMLERCYNKNNKSYRNYGAKGIVVCDEWKEFKPFADWALKNGYDDTLTIDRIDSKKNYCPENCRWCDRKTQNNNTSRNHYITYKGKTQTMAQWAEETGISYNAIKSRLNKHHWSVERALETP